MLLRSDGKIYRKLKHNVLSAKYRVRSLKITSSKAPSSRRGSVGSVASNLILGGFVKQIRPVEASLSKFESLFRKITSLDFPHVNHPSSPSPPSSSSRRLLSAATAMATSSAIAVAGAIVVVPWQSALSANGDFLLKPKNVVNVFGGFYLAWRPGRRELLGLQRRASCCYGWYVVFFRGLFPNWLLGDE